MSKTVKRQLKSVHQNDIYCGAHYLVDTSSISNCAFLLSLLAFKKGCGQISRGCTWALHISSLPIVGQHCSTKWLHLWIFLVLLPHIEQCDNREFVIVKRWQTFGSLLPSSSWTQTACGLIVALFSWRIYWSFFLSSLCGYISPAHCIVEGSPSLTSKKSSKHETGWNPFCALVKQTWKLTRGPDKDTRKLCCNCKQVTTSKNMISQNKFISSCQRWIIRQDPRVPMRGLIWPQVTPHLKWPPWAKNGTVPI